MNHKQMLYGILMLLLLVNVTIATDNTRVGINSAVYNTPSGTQLSIELTEYYHVPVATTEVITYDGVYWYINGFWLNRDQVRQVRHN